MPAQAVRTAQATAEPPSRTRPSVGPRLQRREQMAKIIVRIGTSETSHELTQDVSTVGRSGQNTIALKDVSLSRTHCELRKTGNGWTVVDLGSRNGTTVNGAQVKEKLLEVGDKIEIGNTVMIYEKPIAGRDYTPKDAEAAQKAPVGATSGKSTMMKPTKRETEHVAVGGLADVSSWAKEGRRMPGWIVPALVVALLAGGGFFGWQAFANRGGVASEKNLVKQNPGFEGKRSAEGLPEGWAGLAGSKAPLAVVQNQHHSGKSSLLIDKSTGSELLSGADYTPAIGVDPGTAYEASTWVIGEGFKGSASLRLQWFAKGSDLPLSETYAPWADAPSDWTQVKCVVAPPAGAARLALSCVAVGLEGKACFDDVSIEPASDTADREGCAQLAEFSAYASASGSVRMQRESLVLWSLGEVSYRAGGDMTRQGFAHVRKLSVGVHTLRSEGTLPDPADAHQSSFVAEWSSRGHDVQARFRCSKGPKAGPLAFSFLLDKTSVKGLAVSGKALESDSSGADADLLTVEQEKTSWSMRFLPQAHVRATTAGETIHVECEFKLAGDDGGEALMLVGMGKDVAPPQAAAGGQSIAETLSNASKAELGGRLGEAISGYRAILADAKSQGTREAEAAQDKLPPLEEKAAAALAEGRRLARLYQLTGSPDLQARANKALADVARTYAASDYQKEASSTLDEVNKQGGDEKKVSDDARAQALLGLAQSAKADGQANLAETYARRLLADFPQSEAAKKAQELLK